MANPDFVTFDNGFQQILGQSPEIQLLLEETTVPLFHEAGVYVESINAVFVTSNIRQDKDGKRFISILKIVLNGEHASYEEIFPDIVMANGAVNYQDGILFCEQGDRDRAGGLVNMSVHPSYHTTTIISGFDSVPFNSVNDVVPAKDGAIWFTDPIYGYEQGFRSTPQLPAQVYRFEPQTKSLRAMADSFGRPNGLAFSPDEKTLYVTDTDHIHGDGTKDESRASTIYAFDIMTRSGQPFLSNRRLFAFSPGRAPDGIKCDTRGNVYSGCLDGIHVWSAGGVALGKIRIPGGVANFCFCSNGEIVAMNETKLWRVRLDRSVVGALLNVKGGG